MGKRKGQASTAAAEPLGGLFPKNAGHVGRGLFHMRWFAADLGQRPGVLPIGYLPDMLAVTSAQGFLQMMSASIFTVPISTKDCLLSEATIMT